MSIWRICFSSARYACNFTLLVSHIFASHAIAGLNRRYRPRLLRIVGMKLKSEICGREVCKPATAKTRRIPIAGNTEPDRGIVERTPTPRWLPSMAIQPIRESAAIPAAKSAREVKLNNSPLHLRRCLLSRMIRRRLATMFTRTT